MKSIFDRNRIGNFHINLVHEIIQIFDVNPHVVSSVLVPLLLLLVFKLRVDFVRIHHTNLIIHELQVSLAELLIWNFKLLALVQLLLDSDALLNEFKKVLAHRHLRLNNFFIPNLVYQHHLQLKGYFTYFNLFQVFFQTCFELILEA